MRGAPWATGGNNRRVEVASYGDDTLINFEGGWKTSWFDRRLRVNSAIFYERWKGVQLAVTGQQGITYSPSGRWASRPDCGTLSAK